MESLSRAQEKFIRATERHPLFVGPVACGKTYAACAKSIIYAREHPGAAILICCPTLALAHKSIFPYLHALIAAEDGAHLAQGAQYLMLQNSSCIMVRTVDEVRASPAEWTVAMAGVDELTGSGSDVWGILLASLRQKGFPYPQLWATARYPRPDWAVELWDDPIGGKYEMIRAPGRDHFPAQHLGLQRGAGVI